MFLGYERPRSLGRLVYGSGHAAIVHGFLEQALAGKSRTDSRVPASIKLILVDPSSGERSAPGSGAILEAFKLGTEPPAEGPRRCRLGSGRRPGPGGLCPSRPHLLLLMKLMLEP